MLLLLITYACPIKRYHVACHRKLLQSVLNRGLKLAHKFTCSLPMDIEEDWGSTHLMSL